MASSLTLFPSLLQVTPVLEADPKKSIDNLVVVHRLCLLAALTRERELVEDVIAGHIKHYLHLPRPPGGQRDPSTSQHLQYLATTQKEQCCNTSWIGLRYCCKTATS